jgi:hypothetical protein
MIFGEKIELKAVYVNQHDSVSDIQTPSRSLFILCFLHELLMLSQYLMYFVLYIVLMSKICARNVCLEISGRLTYFVDNKFEIINNNT